MKRLISLAAMGALALGSACMTGCQSDNDATFDADARTRPSVDLEMGGGMNRTGSGSDTGASSSGFDRAGGGFSGWHGANSGSVGSSSARTAGERMTPDDQWTMPGALPPEQGAAGAGGAPTPGR